MSFLVNSFLQNGPVIPTYVGGTTGGFINGGDGTISLTGLTGGIAAAPAAGDYVVVALTTGSTASRSISCSYGTSLVASLTSIDSFHAVTQVRGKVQTSTPDTSIVVSGTGNVTDACGFVVHVWRNIDQTTPQDVTIVTATGGNNAQSDPPAITPVTAGAIILAIGGAAGGTLAVHTSPGGTGVGNFLSGWGADTQDGLTSIYSYTGWTSGAYNPAAFANGGGATSSAWTGVTMALRPA